MYRSPTGDDDDDQTPSYFLLGKTLSEYLVNGIKNKKIKK
jgi:hypothetical protein